MVDKKLITKEAVKKIASNLAVNEDENTDEFFLKMLQFMANNKETLSQIGTPLDIVLSWYYDRIIGEFAFSSVKESEQECEEIINSLLDNDKWTNIVRIDSESFDSSLQDNRRKAVYLISILRTKALDKKEIEPRCYFTLGRLIQTDHAFDEDLTRALMGKGIKNLQRSRGEKAGKSNLGKTKSPLPTIMKALFDSIRNRDGVHPTNEETMLKALIAYQITLNKSLVDERIKIRVLDDKLQVKVKNSTYAESLSMRRCLDIYRSKKNSHATKRIPT